VATFFLVHEAHRKWIVRALRHYAEEHGHDPTHFPYPQLVEQAATMSLPELHVFEEVDGHQFMVCGWDPIDAEHRAHQEPFRKQPLHRVGCFGVPWPGVYGSVNLARWPDPDDLADVEAVARTVQCHLGEFCDDQLPPGDMIAEAVGRAAHRIAELERQSSGQAGPVQEADGDPF
jgi:hypothetical protein